MKKTILFLCVSLLLLVAQSCKDDSGDTASAVKIEIEPSSTGAVDGKMHMFYFDREGELCRHDLITTVSKYDCELAPGAYVFLAVTGVPDDILDLYMSELSRTGGPTMREVELKAFRLWLSDHEDRYPAMMTDEAMFGVYASHTTTLHISFEPGCDPSLSPSSLSVEFQLPQPRLQPFTHSSRSAEGFCMRCIIEIYERGLESPSYREVSYPDVDSEGRFRFQQRLSGGTYSMAVWTDYVPLDAKSAGCLYTAPSLKAVKSVTSPYTANTDAKDASYVYLDEIEMRGQPVLLSAHLQRPLAKYELVCTDVSRYNEKKDELGLPPLEDLQVHVNYLGYFPVGFNAVTGKPNDAVSGVVHYEKGLDASAVDGGEARLGSDWVLVNGDETFVEVELLITDRQGRTVSRVPRVRIDYRRNCLTTVKGKFLTAGIQEGGVHIDTEWEGNFEVEF